MFSKRAFVVLLTALGHGGISIVGAVPVPSDGSKPAFPAAAGPTSTTTQAVPVSDNAIPI